MKDYSKFIQTPYGFITKYEIVDNQILVYTSENEKGKPHIYTANKEVIRYIDERLGNQYRLILKNRKIIKEEFKKKKSGVVKAIGIGLMIFMMCVGLSATVTYSWILPLFLGILSGSLTYAFAMGVAEHMEDKFDEELDLYQEYLNNREKIAKKKEEDANITRYLSENASCNIKTKEQLRETGLIDIAFNIDFMDKVKLKDLRKLLTSYYISEDLGKRQTFLIPNEYKKRVKKKTESNNNEDDE